MNSITLDGVTFRWDGQDLLVTTATSQKRLTGSSALQLSDFLLSIQQDLYRWSKREICLHGSDHHSDQQMGR